MTWPEVATVALGFATIILVLVMAGPYWWMSFIVAAIVMIAVGNTPDKKS